MARIKARSLVPQKNLGYHGAINAIVDRDISAGAIVVVNGDRGACFTVEPASNSSRRRSSGLLYVLRNGGKSGDLLTGLSFLTVPIEDSKKKLGDPVWLGREGVWTFTKPKTNPIQVGEVIDSPSGKRVLLAPQARY